MLGKETKSWCWNRTSSSEVTAVFRGPPKPPGFQTQVECPSISGGSLITSSHRGGAWTLWQVPPAALTCWRRGLGDGDAPTQAPSHQAWNSWGKVTISDTSELLTWGADAGLLPWHNYQVSSAWSPERLICVCTFPRLICVCTFLDCQQKIGWEGCSHITKPVNICPADRETDCTFSTLRTWKHTGVSPGGSLGHLGAKGMHSRSQGSRPSPKQPRPPPTPPPLLPLPPPASLGASFKSEWGLYIFFLYKTRITPTSGGH